MVYSNEYYIVVKEESPVIYNGEPMNWNVVNKEHGTVDATVAAYPHAVMIADNFKSQLEQLGLTQDEPSFSALN